MAFLISRSDHILLFLNIVFLMCVAFIPFPTALLADYLSGTNEHRTTAVAVYSGTLAVTAIFFTILWLYAAGNYRLVNRAIDPLLLRAMTRRYVVGMLLYILAFALAFFSAVASLALIVILALIFVLPEPEGPGSSRRTLQAAVAAGGIPALQDAERHPRKVGAPPIVSAPSGEGGARLTGVGTTSIMSGVRT